MPLHTTSEHIRLGCAGWSLPRQSWPDFPADGSHLERYAARLKAVEINSSFYRPHQRTTYQRWADSVPSGFRFSVKLPKSITHYKRLVGCNAQLVEFLEQAGGLGGKLGCLLIQLPPSLALNIAQTGRFLKTFRALHDDPVALEARHASWFTDSADALLAQHRVARVLADPVLFEPGRQPGGYGGLVYVRLHGSPRMYYSPYPHDVLDALAVRLQIAAASDAAVWCIFDNTASGAATADALYTTRSASG